MKGVAAVVSTLSDLLVGELSAADQYFIQSRLLDQWGFGKLAARFAHERQDELDHADQLLRRIIFLGGLPDVSLRKKLPVGNTVTEMLEYDLAYEMEVAGALRAAIHLCEKEKDFVSRQILEHLLDETEHDHIYFLEQQQHLLAQIGLENYQQSLIEEPSQPSAL